MADRKKKNARAKGTNEESRKGPEMPAPNPNRVGAVDLGAPTTAAERPLLTAAKNISSSPSAGPEGAPDEKDETDLLVVGVGASAGGLDALVELFKHVSPDAMAFIVVQHLAPDHESVLTQLLARSARLTVVTAGDGMTIERNHIYVIPPNADLAVMHRVIRILAPTGAHGTRLPVDYLFRSLAEDQGRASIGVVLSGTGSDGTLGLKAIKAAGGFTFAQDPATAKYDGMPRSALASGAADYSLPPKEIASELARISQRRGYQPVDRGAALPQVQNQLGKLFVLIRSEFGNDLSQYKQTTIDRRIERRMMLHKIGRLDDYVKYVERNRDELTVLYRDMLITVTSFFRDPAAYEALKSQVFPHLLNEKQPGQPIRAWVPACATGEEAYSMAMCLVEYCDESGRDGRIQIFGTDIDDEAIQTARRAVYPANIELDVSTERLNRFFVKQNDTFVVSRRIRDMLVFSKQNILKDAPFSRMDLVSCRNLLIYLQPAAQKRVLRILHYSLNPGGHLFLGSSETVGDAPELFASVDRKHKIYAKKTVVLQAAPVTFGLPSREEPNREPIAARPTLSLQGLVDRKVLELYGPPGVVVNENLDVLQFRGRTGPFLDPAPGAASLNLLRIARFDIHIELKRALRKAISSEERVSTDVTYHEDGKQESMKLDVIPMKDPEFKSRCFLVLFQQLAHPKEVVFAATQGEAHSAPVSQRILELEREVGETREYLQATIEEKESTLEELKSANEELQSSNEELQSTNEELETSKEEMQSTNEELTTVNEELQNRMSELSQTNDDLHNVLSGVDNAVVIVGMDLRIRRFTGAAEKLFHLVPGDVGRNIGFLDTFLGAGALEPKVSAVVHNLAALEEDILAANNRWYALRINPYKTADHAIRGALVTLADIDIRKRAEEMSRDVGAYATRFLAAIGHPLLIVDRKLRVVWANDAFLSNFQLSADETIGSALPNIGARQFANPELRERLNAVLGSASIFRDYEMRISIPEGGDERVRLGGSQISASPETPLALLSIERVSGAETERRAAAQAP